MNIIACITVRMSADRLPGKVLADIAGKPALARVVDRYRQIKSLTHLVVATSTDPSDDPVQQWCNDNEINCYRGSLDDVCERIYHACAPWEPDYVLRGLGDCTFIEPMLQEMLVDVCALHSADAVRMVQSAHSWPVYGAAESPYSWRAVHRMYTMSEGPAREHFGMHLDANRGLYNVVYLLANKRYNETYFRPYRLELDTEADLYLMNQIYERLGPDREPALHEVIDLLGSCPDLALINASIAEKTGPLTTYTPAQRRDWVEHMHDAHIVDWSDDTEWTWMQGHDPSKTPIWCDSGLCYLGYVDHLRAGRNVLVRPGGDRIVGDAELTCSCGAGRKWTKRMPHG